MTFELPDDFAEKYEAEVLGSKWESQAAKAVAADEPDVIVAGVSYRYGREFKHEGRVVGHELIALAGRGR